MLRRATLTAVSLLAVLGASACSPGGSGPSPEPTSNPSESAATSEAPKVENPKNLKAITNACDLLTDEQVKALGGTDERKPPEESKSTYGETKCQWTTDAFSATVTINTQFGGAEKIKSNAGTRDNYELIQFEGYTGARVDAESTLCRIELAVADDQSLEVNYYKNAGGTPEMDDPCGFAEKITGEALKNTPGA
ncbi:Protein of unknown function [Saccharopolyspora kobensis]|uniref:DUF3558 domain-containing protein n=1 Tax=Saccharopolyspora kobensis TaxID=146035 RepID=A0A1H6EL05_9PSEU|nr:DUF3558 domain-containing protein [Saccharopolyspora kobensis]SEG98532.1 Protein of unknown function [Saccharopolyspora kobensis]SFF25961.1 Protein of unknown function [Saccharopolyspora kobensis]